MKTLVFTILIFLFSCSTDNNDHFLNTNDRIISKKSIGNIYMIGYYDGIKATRERVKETMKQNGDEFTWSTHISNERMVFDSLEFSKKTQP